MANNKWILASEVCPFLWPKVLGVGPSYVENLSVEKLDLINQTLLVHVPFVDSVFLQLSNGFELDFVHKEHGPWEEYSAKDVIIKITNCRIVEKYVKNLVSPCNDQMAVYLTCLIAGDIEVLKNG